jgi:hypothetical protein
MLYRVGPSPQLGRPKTTFHHGKSQEEAPPQDVEAQTPEAPEGEPSQEAHVAEVKICNSSLTICKTRPIRAGFLFLYLIFASVKH